MEFPGKSPALVYMEWEFPEVFPDPGIQETLDLESRNEQILGFVNSWVQESLGSGILG